jgi:hypothetical protein
MHARKPGLKENQAADVGKEIPQKRGWSPDHQILTGLEWSKVEWNGEPKRGLAGGRLPVFLVRSL